MRNVDRRRYIRDQVSSGGEVAVRPVRTHSVYEIIPRSYALPVDVLNYPLTRVSSTWNQNQIFLHSLCIVSATELTKFPANGYHRSALIAFRDRVIQDSFLENSNASQLFSFLINRYLEKDFPSFLPSFFFPPSTLPRFLALLARVTRQWNKFP